MKGLKGKVAIVTGGASGIGRSCVQSFVNRVFRSRSLT